MQGIQVRCYSERRARHQSIGYYLFTIIVLKAVDLSTQVKIIVKIKSSVKLKKASGCKIK